MGTALQVFFNLNILPEKVQQVETAFLKQIKSKAAEYLDGKTINTAITNKSSAGQANHHQGKQVPGRSNRSISSVPSSSNASAFRSALWSNVEALLDLILGKMCEAMQLQKILVKKRDIVLGMNFIELLPDTNRNIVDNLWKEILSLLTVQFQQSSADSSTVKQSFEGEFPRLVRLFNDLWSQLCDASVNNSAAFTFPELTHANINLLKIKITVKSFFPVEYFHCQKCENG